MIVKERDPTIAVEILDQPINCSLMMVVDDEIQIKRKQFQSVGGSFCNSIKCTERASSHVQVEETQYKNENFDDAGIASNLLDDGKYSVNEVKELQLANGLLMAELAQVRERYQKALEEGIEMQKLLHEYEQTMNSIIMSRNSTSNNIETGEVCMGANSQHGLISAQVAIANLQHRYDEMRKACELMKVNEDSLKSAITQLQSELEAADSRFNMVKKHAEERLQIANEEVHRLRTTLEIDLSTTKAKLLKTELKVSGLERSLEAKNKENCELMAICDELIQKIDSLGGNNIKV